MFTSRRSIKNLWRRFNISWFVPAVLKYKKLFGEVLLSSLFLQIFALVSPLLFQVIIDKVLVHHSLSTLDVIFFTLICMTVFECVLSTLRAYIFSHTTIKAPADGIIQEMEIHTVGGVVTPAQTLMKLVPSDSVLEVEAMVLNKDVGFVKEGQDVSIKIDSFPYTRYGTINGKLTHLSRDAVENEQLGLVYIARISMAKDFIRVEDKDVRLSAGMNTSAEIKIGRRRLIEIILTPFMEYASESLRER